MAKNELTVISGKGGTGKTSLSASFALLAENPVVADCDVDAADLHILLRPDRKAKRLFLAGEEAEIDQDRCRKCGACLNNCRFQAIDRDKTGQYQISPYLCEGCRLCSVICPYDAIKMERAESGYLFTSTGSTGPMAHAELHPGGDNSGKLVTEVRKEAARLFEEEQKSLIISDGPPGVGCPVLSTITGTSLVLMVTEATRSGLHDLKRIAELVRHFKIPGALCVNRWDINPEITEEIEQYAESTGIALAGRVSYSQSFADTQLKGVPVVAEESKAAEEVKIVWENLKRIGEENGISIQ